MIVPFIGYSQKLHTNTLKPVSFTKVDGNVIYGFNFLQTRHLYETKLLYDISVKKNLYKDSIIESQDSIIDNLNTINKSTSLLLTTSHNWKTTMKSLLPSLVWRTRYD
jgi:basic membrane lipoprotein Med (substrate-binding protein (PBP1-ABC) superfamily)